MAHVRRLNKVVSHLAPEDTAGVEAALVPSPRVVNVCVTGAAGQIAYSVIFDIARGLVFGDAVLSLRLLDIPPMEGKLQGVKMEIDDCAFRHVLDVVCTSDPRVAFNRVNAAIFVGAFPRRKGMLRKDLLEKNASIFKEQGAVLNQFASLDVKVLVVGNPANTNCYILRQYAPDIPAENFSALTRLDQNRARSQVAARLSVPVSGIKNVIIWGNHSSTQYPDLNHALICSTDGAPIPARAHICSDGWIRDKFIPLVQQRGAAVIQARGSSSAASAANAIIDHMRDWWNGTPKGEYVSMGVISDGSYGIPKGLVFSFPVTCSEGRYQIVQGLGIDGFSQQMLDKTTKELEQERDTAMAFLSSA